MVEEDNAEGDEVAGSIGVGEEDRAATRARSRSAACLTYELIMSERERKWIHQSKEPVVFVPILTNHCRWVDLSIETPNRICKWDRRKNRTKHQTGEESEDVPWTATRQIDDHETRRDRRSIDPCSLFLLLDFGEFWSSTSRTIPTDDFGSEETMSSRIHRAHLSFSTWCIRGGRANRSTQKN